jgi:uncharacterized OB-fold protein
MSSRPVPVPDETSAEYWEAAARHVLKLARCGHCGKFSHPPDLICPQCHNPDPAFSFEEVSGQGKVRTWTIVHSSFLNGFDVPFMLVDVQLDDQPTVRMIGRLLDGPDAPVKMGAPVTLGFEDIAPGVSLPAFGLGGAA